MTDFERKFPDAFELEEPQRVYINANLTAEELEKLSPFFKIIASKNVSDVADQDSHNQDKEE